MRSDMSVHTIAYSVHAPDIPTIASSKTGSAQLSGLTKRIIACLDVRSNDKGEVVVTKGLQFQVREEKGPEPSAPATSAGAGSSSQTGGSLLAAATGDVRNLGDPVALAKRYYDQGADEITLLNITGFRLSPLVDTPMVKVGALHVCASGIRTRLM